MKYRKIIHSGLAKAVFMLKYLATNTQRHKLQSCHSDVIEVKYREN